mmetsp:Transcript_8999/g.8379  ORF Transcript_8999/g.8379 Transcript_8999/m.8379 type:complete len:95 (-) Transcript_8999:3913-4197(-)
MMVRLEKTVLKKMQEHEERMHQFEARNERRLSSRVGSREYRADSFLSEELAELENGEPKVSLKNKFAQKGAPRSISDQVFAFNLSSIKIQLIDD